MPVPILKQGSILIASVQAALTDSDAERLRYDLMERVSQFRAQGIIVDVTAIDVMDSFAARSLRTIAHMTRLRGADTVIVGLQPEVAFAMVQLGSGVRRHEHRAGPRRGPRAAEPATGTAETDDRTRRWRLTSSSTSTTPDDIVAARKAGHQLALDLGFSLTDVTMIATAISEIARNITSYAGRGAVRVTVADREGRKALVVRAEDEGPGIADVERAMEDGYSTGRGLGLGLPGARRLMDRLVVESAPGRGTVVEMWKWVPSPCMRTAGSDRSSGRGRVGPCRASTPPATGAIAVDIDGEALRCSAWWTGSAMARTPRPPHCVPSIRSSGARAERLEVSGPAVPPRVGRHPRGRDDPGPRRLPDQHPDVDRRRERQRRIWSPRP